MSKTHINKTPEQKRWILKIAQKPKLAETHFTGSIRDTDQRTDISL